MKLEEVESYAGTEAKYFEDPAHIGLRMRKRSNSEDVRIHVARDTLRLRLEGEHIGIPYVAMDVPLAVLKALVKAVEKG